MRGFSGGTRWKEDLAMSLQGWGKFVSPTRDVSSQFALGAWQTLLGQSHVTDSLEARGGLGTGDEQGGLWLSSRPQVRQWGARRRDQREATASCLGACPWLAEGNGGCLCQWPWCLRWLPTSLLASPSSPCLAVLE